jgi:hypothetical protein
LAYIFDPIRNTFVDDEDTSLGNKLALNDEEFEELLKIPGVFRASEAMQPPPRQEVLDREAINRFIRDNRANGGRINLQNGSYDTQRRLEANPSKWLQNYSYSDLLSDLEKGLSKMEIAKNLYNNNKQLYDSIPIEEETFLKQYRNIEEAKIGKISNSIKNRLNKDPALKKLNEKNVATLKKLENSVVKDVDKWIKNNKSKYIGKQGAYQLFENDLFKFLEKDYSRLIKTAKGGTGSTVAGDKFISKFAKTSGYSSNTGEANNYLAVKKKLYKGLGIDFGRDMTGGKTKKFTTTTNAVKKLLPIAQEKGIIPKTYIGAKNKPLKITPENYFKYMKETEINPIQKIFNNVLKFSVEHPGGLARAEELLDSESLAKIIPLERGEFGQNIKGKQLSANFLKGRDYDSQITRFIRKAKFEATNLSQAKNFIKKANAVSNEAAEKFGTLQSTYTAVKGNDGKIQIKVKHPNISLNDSLVSKTKNAIHSFIANDGMNRDVFNKLPKKLQKAITLINEDKNANAVIKSHIQDIFPEEGKGIKLNSFAGVIDFDMIPDNVKGTVAKAAGALGKSLKALGVATVPLDIIPFSEQSAKGLTGTDLFKTGGAKLIEDYLNAPQSIASLFDKELYEPFTFGSRYADKIEASIPMEERILNQKLLAFDKTMPRLVDDIDIAPSKNELEEMRKDFIEDVDIDTSKNLPFVPLEEDKTELSPIIKSLVTPDQTLQDFMAHGGRAGFSNGGATGMSSDEFVKELEYYFTNPDADLPKATTFRETMNPIEIFNDMIDPRNYPYYADRLAKTGIRIGEFGLRVLPAVGKLIGDVTTKPSVKIEDKTGTGYIQDYDQMPKSRKIKGTGIFSEFLDNLVGTEMTEGISRATGLNDLIKMEEQKMMDRRTTVGPKVLADTATLGVEFTAPIFPGLKLLKAYAKARKLPVDDTTKELLEKEIKDTLDKNGISRRDFMKTAGAGASLVIAKMLGFGDEFTKATKVVRPTVEQTATGGVPPYFFELVKKIKKSGRALEPEFDPRVENNMQLGDYVMRENMSTGEISIQKTKEGMVDTGSDYLDGTISEETITYKPGEDVIGTDGKTYRTPDEYEEFTTRPDINDMGKMKDVEPGLDSIEEIIELMPNQLKRSELEAAGYNVEAFPDNIKQLLIDDLQKID